MSGKVMKVGILSREAYRARTLAIAKGTHRPKRDEPKIWFESIRSLTQVLSSENQDLLRIIVERKPNSLKELAAAPGRRSSNLSRTLRRMARHGIVELARVNRRVRPIVRATDFHVEFGLSRPSGDGAA